MQAKHERSSTFLVASDKAQASQNEIREALESSDEDAKVDALQKAITGILAGEQFPSLFITIVRYVLPSENHMVQKLLLLYLVSAQAQMGGGGGRPRPQSCLVPTSVAGAVAGAAVEFDGPAWRLTLQETIEKTDAQGKLLPEMVRCCAAVLGLRSCGGNKPARLGWCSGPSCFLSTCGGPQLCLNSGPYFAAPCCRSSSARTCGTTCSTPTSTSGA